MNEKKLRKLFESARKEPAPKPSENFVVEVAQAVRREPAPFAPPLIQATSLFDQLNRLFPRVAVAAIMLIGLLVAGDFWRSTGSDLSGGITRLTDQWLFVSKGF